MSFDQELTRELAAIEALGRRRDLDAIETRDGGVDFVSNDYLGLARDPRVVTAAREALDRFGAGARAARLLGGGAGARELEREVADWLGAEAALAFPSGYQANVGLIAALVGPGDAIVLDELSHASLIDGARMSRARVLVARHGCAIDLDRQLTAARGARRSLVSTEGVFSMDGDRVDLAALAEVCARHDAVLVVDEAHAIGIVGAAGQGAWADSGARGDCIRVVTGGKALGVGGGIVVGSTLLRDLLVQRARSFVFTTAQTPAATAALRCAVGIARDADDLRAKVRANAHRLAAAVDLAEPAAAILPWPIGDERAAILAEQRAREAGFDVRCVRPPTVPDGSSRLRVVVHADHTHEQLDGLAHLMRRLPRPNAAPTTRTRRGRCTFVAGTDTGVGKTVVSALLMASRDTAVYWKPVQTGDDSDTSTVRRLAELGSERVLEPVHDLPLPASPHQAGAAAGVSIRLDELARRLDAHRRSQDEIVVELAGGLLVPYGDGHTQIDWLARERADIVLVARSGLGTLNHTLLSVEALAGRCLAPSCVYVVGPPHASNLATLRAALPYPVIAVPWFDDLSPEHVARWSSTDG